MTIARLHHEQDGVALMSALLALVVLTGLSVVFVGRSLTETQVSAASRDLEGAVHIAESSADLLIHQLSGDMGTGAPASADFVHEMAGGADERQWARDLLEEMRGDDSGTPASTWVETPAGEAYAVQPQVDGEVEPVVLAVGAVPSFDAQRARVRVVRLQIEQDEYRPDFAFLTDGLFSMGGNSRIVVEGCDADAPTEDECVADVHANSDVDFSGVSDDQLEGRVTTPASGTCDAVSALMGCRDGDDGVGPEPVPTIRAADFYEPDGHDDWYDLCPDGVIREGSADGPCDANATVVWEDQGGGNGNGNGGGTTEGLGWSFGGGTWSGGAVQSGIFYVHHADAKVTGTAGGGHQQATILVASDPPIGSGTGPVTGGSLEMTGNPRLGSRLPDLLFVADRDIRLRGNGPGGGCGDMPTHLGGLISAGEQISTKGTVDLRGAVIEQSAEDLVNQWQGGLGGTMCLDYDADMAVELAGYWVITYWNEL